MPEEIHCCWQQNTKYDNNEYLHVFIEVASSSLKILLNQMVDKTMVAAGGSKFTPNIIFVTDRRIIIIDPSMLGLREQIVDFPYDMIKEHFHVMLYLHHLD